MREGWSLERGLELWLVYNKRLLEIVDERPDVSWYQHGISPIGRLYRFGRSARRRT